MEIFNQRRLSDVSFVIDRNLCVSEGNRSFLKMFNITDPNIVLSDYIQPVDAENLKVFLSNFTNENETKYFTLGVKPKESYVRCLLYFSKEEEKFNVDLKELSYSKELLDKALLESREYTSVLKTFDAHYFIYDGKKVILKNTKDLASMFEGDVSEFHEYLGNCFNLDLFDKDCHEQFDELFKDLSEFSVDKGYKLLMNDGFSLSIHTKKVSTRNNAIIVANISTTAGVLLGDNSYSEKKDGLTDLYNKKAITEMITKQINVSRQPTSLIILDVDKFKECNDTFGHVFGDKVLVAVSNVIKDAVNGIGFAGRIGGDEFLIALNKTSEEDIRSVTRNIRLGIQWSIPALEPASIVTCSMGIARAPLNADNYEDLFKVADKCLYIAKSKGRNCYVIYKPEIHDKVIIANEKNAENVLSGQFYSESAQKEMKILHMLHTEKTEENIRAVLKEILDYMEVMKICVYDKDLKPLYIIGKDENDHRTGYFQKNYFKFFNQSGFLHIDNTNSFDTLDKEKFEMYRNSNIASTLEIKCNDKYEHLKILVCYDIYKPARTFAKEKIIFAIMAAKYLAEFI